MRRIRAVLADDEPVILRGLRMMVDWDRIGIEVVGQAEDGKQLLMLLDELEPDLILSDICMPGMSGIDVLKHIESMNRSTKVIFVSAYREFSYAQDAVKYGAIDYLIKPINMEQLELVLVRAVSLIRNASEDEKKRDKLKYLERNIRVQSIGELLDRLTDGDLTVIPSLQELAKVRDGRKMTICVGQYNESDTAGGRWQERERKLIDFAVTNVMTEIINDCRNGHFFRKGSYFCFLVMDDETKHAQAIALTMRDNVNCYLKLEMTFGIGEPVQHVRECHLSFEQAQEALQRGYFLGWNNVISYGDTAEWQEPLAGISRNELQERLLNAIVSASGTEGYKDTLGSWLSAMKQAAEGSKEKAISNICNSLLAMKQQLQGMGLSVDAFEESFQSLLEYTGKFHNFHQLEARVSHFVSQISEAVQLQLGNKEVAQVTQVKQYIEKHIADNITLETISSLVYMNPSYFSSFFKKHTGENFKNYVTSVRMNQARRLLLHTDLMVYEVAERVGYQNARLFSEMFKKMFGQLPQEYKQKKGRQNDATQGKSS